MLESIQSSILKVLLIHYIKETNTNPDMQRLKNIKPQSRRRKNIFTARRRGPVIFFLRGHSENPSDVGSKMGTAVFQEGAVHAVHIPHQSWVTARGIQQWNNFSLFHSEKAGNGGINTKCGGGDGGGGSHYTSALMIPTE